MNGLDEDEQIRAVISEMWHKTLRLCNRVLHQIDVYGYDLMNEQDPGIHEFEKIMRFVVCPMLDQVVEEGNVDPHHGMKVDNIRQYSLHLREMAQAIRQDDRNSFDQHANLLAAQAMLIGDD